MKPKALIFELEPRIMFDAVGAAVIENIAESNSTNDSTIESTKPQIVTLLNNTTDAISLKVNDAVVKAKEEITTFFSSDDAYSNITQIFSAASDDKQSSFNTLRSQILDGSYSIEIKILDAETMGVAEGAYTANGPNGTPVIYINGDWAAGADAAQLQSVLIEEIGHSFDTVLNGTNDSPGDEGERFAALVTTGVLDSTVGWDNDHFTMTVEGDKLNVELANFNFVNAYAMVYDLNNNNAIVGSSGETDAAKEQNSHNFNTASLGSATIDDNNYNSAYFSGNDVSAIGINIGGTTYYGWISRPIKAGGIVRGFYFWTDADFTDLATAQADGNQDGDGNTNDNKGFLLVVDQAWFDSQIASSHTAVSLNNSFDGNLGTITYSNVSSSSDRVDSALNSLITTNTAPVANNDTADGTNGTTATVEAGYSVTTVNGAGNVLTNDTDANSDTLTVTNIGTSSSQLTSVTAGTTSVNGTSVTGKYGILTIGSDGTYTYVVDNTNTTVDALQTGQTLNETFTYSISDGHGGSSSTTLSVVISGSNDAPVANPDYNTAKESTTIVGSTFAYTGYSATGDVTVNDTDVDTSDTKTIVGSSVSGSYTGDFTVNPASSVLTFSSSNGQSLGSINSGLAAYVALGSAPSSNTYGYFGLYYYNGSTYTQVTETGLTKNPDGTYSMTLSNTPNYYASSGPANGGGTPTGYTAISDINTFFANNPNVDFYNSTAWEAKGSQGKGATVSSSSTSASTDVAVSGSLTGTVAVGMTVSGTNVVAGTTVSALTYDSNGILTDIRLSKALNGATTGNETFTFTGNSGVGVTLNGAHGTLTLAANGTYTYTPTTDNSYLSSGQSAVEIFDYTMQDSQGVTSSSKLYITVYGTGSNDPTLTNDTGTAKETGVQPNSNTTESGSNATGNVLTNDTTGSGGVVATFSKVDGTGTVSSGSSIAGLYGTLQILADGTYTYTVDNTNTTVNSMLAGQSLSEIFLYKVTNTAGGSSTAKLTITINGTNDQIVAVNNTAAVQEDVTLSASGDIVTNDTDVDLSDTKIVSNAGTSSANTAITSGTTSSNGLSVVGTYGTLTIGADGTYSYILNNASATVQNLASGQIVYDTFTYEVKDTDGSTSTATLSVTVTGSNEPPVNTIPSSISMNQDTTLSLTGSNAISVSDADGNLNWVVLNVDHGTLSFISTTAGVTIAGDGTGNIRISGTQADINSALAKLTYTPTSGFEGKDNLTIVSQDTSNANDSDGLTIYVNATASVTEDSSDYIKSAQFTIADTITAQNNVVGTYGTFSIDVNGNWTYTADNTLLQPLKTTAQATDAFTITSADGTTYTITVTLNGVDDAPVASPFSKTLQINSSILFSSLSPSYTDAENDAPTDLKIVTLPSDGIIEHYDGSSWSAISAGTEISLADMSNYRYASSSTANSFSFTWQLKAGGLWSADTIGTFIVSIAGNTPPTATDSTISVDEDTHTLLALTDFGYSDTDNDSISKVKITQLASNGKLEFYNGTSWIDVTLDQEISASSISAGTLRFSPGLDENGNNYSTFQFKVNDGTDYSLSVNTITYNVTPVNDAPTAGNDTLITDEDTAKAATLPAATDIDGDSVTYAKATDPSHGTVSVNADGTYTYTPSSNYNGSDSFTYSVSDGNGGTNTYTVNITVNPKAQQYIPSVPFIPTILPSEPVVVIQTDVQTDMIITKTLHQLQDQSDKINAEKPVEEHITIEQLTNQSRNDYGKGAIVTNTGRVVLDFTGQHETIDNDVIEVRAFQMDPKFIRVVVKDSAYSEGQVKFELYSLEGSEAPEWLKIDSQTGLITGIPPKGVEKVVVQVKIIGKDGKIKSVDIEINITNKTKVSASGTLSQQMQRLTYQYHGSDELITILNKITKEA